MKPGITRPLGRTLVVYLLGLGFVAGGCLPTEDPLLSAYTPPKQAAIKDKTTLSLIQVVPFVYNRTHARDPFRPPYVQQANRIPSRRLSPPTINRRKRKPKTPLERYDVGELTLTAIMAGMAHPIAMVRAPDGKVYVLRTGMRVGKEGEQVTKIVLEGVVLTRVLRGVHAGRMIRRRILRFPRPKSSRGVSLP
jgi:Tfp pilus assembly protein PilP